MIGAPLEARVRLTASGELLALLQRYAAELPGLFIVSKVKLEDGENGVLVERASGPKCERCWKYTGDVGSAAEYPTVCASCAGILDEIFRES